MLGTKHQIAAKASVAKIAKVAQSALSRSDKRRLSKLLKDIEALDTGGLILLDFRLHRADEMEEILTLHPAAHLEFDGTQLFVKVHEVEHEQGATQVNYQIRDSLMAAGFTDAEIISLATTTLRFGAQTREMDGAFATVRAGIPSYKPGEAIPMPSIAVLCRNYPSTTDLQNVLAWALTPGTAINGVVVVQIHRDGAAKLPTTRLTLEYFTVAGGPNSPVQLFEIGKVDAAGTAIPAGTICAGPGTHVLQIPIADYFAPDPVPAANAGQTIAIDGYAVKSKMYFALGWTLP